MRLSLSILGTEVLCIDTTPPAQEFEIVYNTGADTEVSDRDDYDEVEAFGFTMGTTT